MKPHEEKAKHILLFCASKGDWSPDFDCPVFGPFLREASTLPELVRLWDWEAAVDRLQSLLKGRSGMTKADVTDSVAVAFADDFVRFVRGTARAIWIVVPLTKASLERPFHSDPYMVLPGQMDRSAKLEMLAEKVGISLSELRSFASHTEKSRSPGFYEWTLLCIRVRHQYDWIFREAPNIAMWNVAFLRAVFHGLVPGDVAQGGIRFESVRQAFHRNTHLAILGPEPEERNHHPLRFNATCSFGLDWLEDKSLCKALSGLHRGLLLPPAIDPLASRFLRSLRLFSRSVDLDETKDMLDGMALPLLLMSAAAEGCLLGNRHGEKRARLTCLLSSLARPAARPKRDFLAAVDRCYRRRSEFLHVGRDTYFEGTPEGDEGGNHGDFRTYRNAIARVLAEYPRHRKSMADKARRRPGNGQNGGRPALDDEWLRWLEEIWSDALVSGPPVRGRTMKG